MVRCTFRPLYLREKSPRYAYVGEWEVPSGGKDTDSEENKSATDGSHQYGTYIVFKGNLGRVLLKM